MSQKKSNKLNFFTLAMINIALVMSLGGLPVMAKEGLTLIFYDNATSFL